MKPIRLSAHAMSYLEKRGFTIEEVQITISTSVWESAVLPERFQCHKDFPYNKEWNGNFYPTKQVRPIFVEEATEIVVVTVYTYFF